MIASDLAVDYVLKVYNQYLGQGELAHTIVFTIKIQILEENK